MKKNSLIKRNKGITLIALVITIIVLLILAGVSIATLTGQNGILTKAKDAASQTKAADAKEQVQLAVTGSLDNSGKIDKNELDKNLNSIHATGFDKTKDLQQDVTLNGQTVTIKADGTVDNKGQSASGGEGATQDGVKIPAGFHYAGGTKDTGLVISDEEGDDLNNTKGGNQFVWVPVDENTFDTNFKRVEGYYYGSLDSMISDCGEADGTGINSKITENSEIQQEAKDMYASVKINGGFYITRYEAGKEGTDTVVSKKNATVWNNIPWSSSNIITGGAVEKARNFAKQNNYTSVTSTLCYGVQWDATMNFIDSNYITNQVSGNPNCASDSFLVNSKGKGWYGDNYSSGNPEHKTGVDVGTGENCVNNIYDLGGNVNEWTMESCNTHYRVYRGGSCSYTGSNYPASNRNYGDPTGSSGGIGFRLTLFL